MNTKKIVVISLASIFAILFTVTGLALNNSQLKNIPLAPNQDYIKKIVVSNISSTSAEISLPELNRIINDIFEKELYVTSINPKSKHPINACIPISLHGIHTTLNFNASIKLIEKNFEIQLANTKIGRLPTPINTVLNTIEKIFPNDVKKLGKKIIIPATLPLNFKKIKFDVEFIDLSFTENCINFKTKSALENLASNNLKSFISCLYLSHPQNQ